MSRRDAGLVAVVLVLYLIERGQREQELFRIRLQLAMAKTETQLYRARLDYAAAAPRRRR